MYIQTAKTYGTQLFFFPNSAQFTAIFMESRLKPREASVFLSELGTIFVAIYACSILIHIYKKLVYIDLIIK